MTSSGAAPATPGGAGADVLVSVVVPLHESANIVEQFVEDTLDVLARSFRHFELILVDDGSTDDTVIRAEALLGRFDHLRLAELSRHFGLEAAVSAGLELSIGDWTVVLDPNTDPPEIIPALIERVRSRTDMLYGVRNGPSGDAFYLRWAAKLFYAYSRRVMRVPLPRDTTNLRVLSRQAVNAILNIQKRELYFRVLTLYIGFRSEPFRYNLVDREGGRPRPSLAQMISTAVALIVDNSSHPLRFVSALALATSGFNLLYSVYVIVTYIFKKKTAEGWVTLSLQNSLQWLVLSLVLTALCEYTGRMFNRLGERPSFYIMDEKSSAVQLREERRNVVTDSAAVSVSPSEVETAGVI